MPIVIKKILKFFKPIVRAYNDAGERIESMRFTVPALRVGVLEYGAGQLQTGNTALDGKPVKLYYPPEAVSNEKFLKSLETAPVVVGGHDSTTNENNKKIDGWAHTVNYDAALKAAMISGVVKGNKEVAYIKGNLGASGFGASAFVDIYDLKVENGVTPDGQEYNAIANELRATHVALAPHVRDPENKIRVTNAVCINTEGKMVEAENGRYSPEFEQAMKASEKNGNRDNQINAALTFGNRFAVNPEAIWKWAKSHNFNLTLEGHKITKNPDEFVKSVLSNKSFEAKNSHGEIINNEEKKSMEPKEIAALVKNAVEEAITAKNEGDRMDAMEETLKKHGDALNEINEKLTPKKAESENAAFEGKETPEEEKEEKKDEKEGATLENAKPSQEMVKVFSTALNVDFGAKTPSFSALAALSGIKETDPALRIAAVNAKFAEMQKNEPKKENNTAAAHNTVGEVF